MSDVLKFKWNALQLQGARRRQEDACRVKTVFDDRTGYGEQCRVVLAIADGLGGHPDGDWASRLAVDLVIDHFDEELGEDLSFPATEAEWRKVFTSCHDTILRNRRRGSRSGPATTLIAGTVAPDGRYSLTATGDSSAWEVSPAGVRRLCGVYGSGSWMRYSVGYDIGGHACDGVQMLTGQLVPGGKLVLATDGIEVLPEATIEDLIRLPMDPSMAELHRAVVAAMDDHQDNVTVVMLEVQP